MGHQASKGRCVRLCVCVARRLGRFVRGGQALCLNGTLASFVMGDNIYADYGLPKNSDLAKINHLVLCFGLLRTLRSCVSSDCKYWT